MAVQQIHQQEETVRSTKAVSESIQVRGMKRESLERKKLGWSESGVEIFSGIYSFFIV